MKRKFVVTQNVKRFVDLMDTLKNAPANLPKMALVYGDFGLGKSQTIMWWVTNNDAIYVRCNHKMSARWLLTEIVEELDYVPTYLTSLLFKQIEDKLRERPKVLVVDEVDFLLNNSSAIEIVRDLHDKIGIPVVLVGMSLAEAKLKLHKHIYDRLLGVLKFETFNKDDVAKIVTEISEVEFEPDALELICTKFNQFRQIVKFLNKAENVAEMNNLKTITLTVLEGILNEK